MHKRTTILIGLLAAWLAMPGFADAGTRQESLFQDDTALVYSGDSRREQTLDELQRLGVDVIRSNLLWSQVALGHDQRSKPGGDPYATAGWYRWDQLVRGAQARGMDVQLTLTGPLPLWASKCDKRSDSVQRTCRPHNGEFGRFVAAAAQRYPSVHRWSIWNEPNQAGWLYPQYRRKRKPEAPWRYRKLALKGIKKLRQNGHKGDRILLGETAPIGRRSGSWRKRSMAPGKFLRDVLCINRRGRAIRSRKLRCHRKVPKLRVRGYAHHPYTRGAGHNPRRRARRDDITLRHLGRLKKILRQGRKRGRLPRWVPIYLTEFGFQTDPPDNVAGVRPGKAARWLNMADWMAYQKRKVRSVAQYEMFDEEDRGAFQTGLRYHGGRKKPSYRAYRLPIWVVERGRRSSVWGWARAGDSDDRVEILYKKRRGRKWRRLRTVSPNSRGFLRVRTRRRAYKWRLEWRDETGDLRGRSRKAKPASR
jgi:Cellulase (glycosyl hydrolase family 5)